MNSCLVNVILNESSVSSASSCLCDKQLKKNNESVICTQYLLWAHFNVGCRVADLSRKSILGQVNNFCDTTFAF